MLLTLYRQRFSLRKTHFLPLKRFFEVLCCQMPLNFATKAFSYNLAKFWASFCCQLYNILLSRMRISQNVDCFFFADLFLIFFRFFCFPFSLPFFSLHLLPFITFLSTANVLASVSCKNLEMEHWSTRWLGLFYHQLCSQSWTRFSGITLPEFVRYSKWTRVWMDLSLLC